MKKVNHGALQLGYKYAVAIFVALLTAVANANATALLLFGLAIVAITHGKIN